MAKCFNTIFWLFFKCIHIHVYRTAKVSRKQIFPIYTPADVMYGVM